MLGYIPLALLGLVLFWLARKVLALQDNIAAAKASGLPYVVSPLDGIAGYLWTLIHDPVLYVLKNIPYFRDRSWHIILEPHRGWNYAEEMREAFGEYFLIVSPGQIYMNIINPAAIIQLTTRRNDFLKPVELYGIVDMYGSSMLSSEGDNWKRHRRVVAPAFSEKSNALVWKESLRQASGMMNYWSKLDGNSPAVVKTKDTAPDTALMTLHVISGAGFGVRQIWDGEDEKLLGAKAIPGFNTAKLERNHRMPFKTALNIMLHGIIWMAILPVWLLKLSPFEVHKKLVQAFFECGDYFQELSQYRVRQLEQEDAGEQGAMDLMGPLIKASQNSPNDAKGQYMTQQDVIANSWIFLFAGHETTGNTLHFSFLFLAISLDAQAHLQKDIDSIVGSKSSEDWTYETDMTRLYSSMVGATMNETLRLMPPIVDIPKIVKKNPQPLVIDGKSFMIPTNTFIHLNAVSVQRIPQYWPHSPSKISDKPHDLDDFVPERWLLSASKAADAMDSKASSDTEAVDVSNKASFDSKNSLLTPVKGSFIPFSEGARACPGKRFAQVEITAVLAFIFKTYTVELDVSEWESDANVEKMSMDERTRVYEKAKAKARKLIRESESIVTLQMMGTSVPLRFVKRGEERFMERHQNDTH